MTARILEKLLVITVCASLMACTTLRSVPDWQTPAAPVQKVDQGLKPGDKLIVTTAGNLKAELAFVGLTTDTLQGTAGKDQKVVETSRDQIILVERREISAWKTTGLVATVVIVALLAIGLSNAASMPSEAF
jgi:hypothetical protein